MAKKNRIQIFQKPDSICRELTNDEIKYLGYCKDHFADHYLNSITQKINSLGLNFRHATSNDIIKIKDFIDHHYREDLIDEVSPYDMYRFIEFGYGVIIEDREKKILGCLFEIGYDTVEKPSYSIRLGIHESLHGKDLGRLVTLYTCFLAMRRGSMVKKGLIDFNNYVQIYIQVNKIGWIFDEFFPDLKGMGSCYECTLPLTKSGLLKNKIDDNRVKEFINNSRENIDFIIKNANDLDGIARIYEETEFKISAFLRKDIYGSAEHQLLLIPLENMKIKLGNNESHICK